MHVKLEKRREGKKEGDPGQNQKSKWRENEATKMEQKSAYEKVWAQSSQRTSALSE